MANTKSLKPFKKGYDPRRWLGGRGKKSADEKKAEEILRAVYWKEFSRLFDPVTGKAIVDEEDADTPVTALELAIRKEIKTAFYKAAERVAGKVVDKKDITSKGESINPYMDMPKEELLALMRKKLAEDE